MFGINFAAKIVDIACMPFYLIAVASDSASNLRGILNDQAYLRGFDSGYKQAIRDYRDA